VFSEYELEQRLREHQTEVDAALAKARILLALEEAEKPQPSLRRRLATALVQLSVRIDSRAAEALASESAA